MAVFTGETRKVADLASVSRYDDSDEFIIHDGNGLKKVQAKFILSQQMFSGIEDDSFASSADYEQGDFLVLGGNFYKVKTAIAEGDPLVAGTNITEKKLGKLLAPLSFENSGFHNSIYRGKNLGTSYTAAQQAAVAAGTFDDMFIGDYWVIDGVTWRIAAFDYWFGYGDGGGVGVCNTHHIVIVPDSNLLSADGSTTHYMNTSNTTTGGYVGSGFYSGTNADSSSNTAKARCRTMAVNAFGSSHILTHREYLTNAITNGYPSAGAWYDSDIELMTEAMVYGSAFFTPHNSLGATIPNTHTIDHSQLPLFALNHRHICNRAYWWLRDVVSAAAFAAVTNNGHCYGNGASDTNIGIRPAFGIC